MITDELTGKRRQTRYRMTEEQARERFGDDAVKVEYSLEVRQATDQHTSSFQKSGGKLDPWSGDHDKRHGPIR